MLSKHGNKIIDLDCKASAHNLTSNVKLLREIAPKFDNQYEAQRTSWNGTALLKGSAMGSGVKAISSSSTWKRKFTSY
jgi:hypothetical protein